MYILPSGVRVRIGALVIDALAIKSRHSGFIAGIDLIVGYVSLNWNCAWARQVIQISAFAIDEKRLLLEKSMWTKKLCVEILEKRALHFPSFIAVTEMTQLRWLNLAKCSSMENPGLSTTVFGSVLHKTMLISSSGTLLDHLFPE